MPNVMSVLRAEIRRLARKESKEAVRDLRRQVTAMRRRMAATKQRMAELERLAKRSATTAGPAAAAKSEESMSGQQIRFSPRWVRVHRAKLKLSRKDYSKLVGVSPQTILLWESGKTRPRRGVLAAWRELRLKGIRELKSALGAGGGKLAGGKGAKRAGRPARRAKAGRRAAPKRGARGMKKAGAVRGARRRAAAGRAKRTRGARAKKK